MLIVAIDFTNLMATSKILNHCIYLDYQQQ